jgi:hypothetical protein
MSCVLQVLAHGDDHTQSPLPDTVAATVAISRPALRGYCKAFGIDHDVWQGEMQSTDEEVVHAILTALC